jgi:hypothetical protein
MTADLIGNAASVATLLGLPVAVWQARLARSAAEAARAAADGVARRYGDHRLLRLLLDLRSTEATIRTAWLAADDVALVRAIASWRETASDVRGFLAWRGELTKALAAQFAVCDQNTHAAEMRRVSHRDLLDIAVTTLLREIGTLATTLSEVSARLLTEVPDVRP